MLYTHSSLPASVCIGSSHRVIHTPLYAVYAGMLSCVTGVQAAWPGLAARTSPIKGVVTTFYFQQNSGEQMSLLRGASMVCKSFR